jgi:hypothetical protein
MRTRARMRTILLVSAIAALSLTLSPSALAAGGTSDATGLVGADLSVAAATPALMTFTPSTPGTSSSVVTVTSTQPSWNLTVHDSGVTTPGQMDRVNCVTRAPLGDSLDNALSWSAPAAGTSGSLSGTPATVKANGSLVASVTVNFTQPIGATEDLTAGDCYGVTLTWTVT